MTLSSHNFPSVYETLGLELSELGCIMLDVENSGQLSDLVPDHEDDLYVSSDPKHWWVKGDVTAGAHVTVLYGLLASGPTWKPLVDVVLDGWEIPDLFVDSIEVFDSPYADDEFYCIVAKIRKTEELVEGHHRLSFLPHVNTFEGYTPHVTIAYIKKDDETRDKWVAALNRAIIRGTLKSLKTKKELNYGGNHD
jgi:hypothetical protein